MRSNYEYLYREDFTHHSYTTFYVTIERPGPRGGKRPPLIKASLKASDYDDAVRHVEQTFLGRTKTTVVAG